MLVPRTAEGFRATVSALRSPDVGGGVTSHIRPPGGSLRASAGQKPRQAYA
jgi:hypothetical protein